MNRRQLLASLPALAALGRLAAAEPAPAKTGLGLVIHSYPIRSSRPKPPEYPPVSEPLDFLREAARVGAAGVQTRVGTRPEAELARLKAAAAELGLYLEGMIGLPATEGDVPRFEAELKANRAAGVEVVR